MSVRYSIVLIGTCFFLYFLNHFFFDWERITRGIAEENLSGIVVAQRADLISWSKGQEMDDAFRKRSLCQGRLVDWSDDRPFEFSPALDSIGVVESEHGVFLYQRITNEGCEYISGYPLFEYFLISNQYLKNRRSSKVSSVITTVSKDAPYPFESLLKYDVKYGPNAWLDGIIGLIFILVFIFEYVKFSSWSVRSFWLATGGLVMLRFISLYFNILDTIFRMPLFNPVNFTASFFNPTLGDLLVNAILTLVVTIQISKHLSDLRKGELWLVYAILGLGCGLLVFHIPWSILNNSQLVLDIGKSISFSFLRSISYSIVGIFSICYFVYLFHFYQFLERFGRVKHALTVFSAAGAFIFFLNPFLSIPAFFAVFFFLVLARFKERFNLTEFNYQNLLFILIYSVGLGAMLSLFVYKHGERDELFAKRKFANYLLLKQDVLGEYYLSKAIENLNADPELEIIASDRSKSDLIESVLSEFSSPYFNKYEIEMVFQDYQKLSLNSRFSVENSLLIPENESDYENLYFIDDGTNFKYISKLYIGDLVALVILQIKKRLPTTVYPALLTDSKYFTISNEFDYAVFAENEILFHRSKFGQGEWPGDNDFENPNLYDKGIEKNDKHYYGVRTDDGRTILIISDLYPLQAQLANFSFFFLVVLFFIVLYVGINSIVIKKRVEFNFTSKIQVYLSVAFIAPLFVTGFALLSSLNTSYREEINRTYLKQALYISEMLSSQFEKDMSEVVQSEMLAEIGSYIQSDISFYNSSGYLLSTSQPEIFTLGLQSNLINPVVFSELLEKENQSLIADESIGSLDYKVCYSVVNGPGNEVAGFIAMPFFDSRNHLNRQQIEVFENLITIFGFIFIAAILLGNAVLNSLLYPLRMVAGKIREITLQEVNKPIDYKSSDEIGSLVKDYNQMLLKLEDSKLALAKSQKETAWKEIAKQVAHEIKNPLTPMQLKIQQLLRRYDKGTKEHDSLSSLLTQVDTLSHIAESFSAFAEMPVPNNQVYKWNELVEEVTRLYNSDNVRIDVHCQEEVYIKADKDIFRRILNNLVLNAIQATEEGPVVIDVKLVKKADKGLLSVSDQGRGVPEKLKDKIFLRYFSTKSSGSGIGLALAKKGIENAGGNIWFESKDGEGTTFYISMPMYTG